MAIIKKVEPTPQHVCPEPPGGDHPEREYGAGTVWECDGCGKQRQLKEGLRAGYVWAILIPWKDPSKRDYRT